jgi:hypothetical protein
MLTGAFGDEFCFAWSPVEDAEALIGANILRRRAGLLQPARYLNDGARRRFLEAPSRHFSLPKVFNMGSLHTLLNWASGEQLHALYEAGMNAALNLLHPFCDDEMLDLSLSLPGCARTSAGAFKPLLTDYLRRNGGEVIAKRQTKTSLAQYFREVRLQEMTVYLAGAEVLERFDASGFIDIDVVRRLVDETITGGHGLRENEVVALWQVGSFLQEVQR